MVLDGFGWFRMVRVGLCGFTVLGGFGAFGAFGSEICARSIDLGVDAGLSWDSIHF